MKHDSDGEVGKLINWLKGISKNPLIQKFCLISFITLCAYLVIPRWQISHQRNRTIAVNRFTGETREEQSQHWEIIRLKKRVNELVDFINTIHFDDTSDKKFSIKSISIEREK